jgi:hypothetical protein
LPNLKLDAAVTRFSPALDPATKTMLCEIELANPGSDLRPGMYATVRLILERKPGALLIPADALVVEKTRSSTFKVLDNKAARQVVKTGFNDGGWVEILEGLTGDERLIAVGNKPLTRVSQSQSWRRSDSTAVSISRSSNGHRRTSLITIGARSAINFAPIATLRAETNDVQVIDLAAALKTRRRSESRCKNRRERCERSQGEAPRNLTEFSPGSLPASPIDSTMTSSRMSWATSSTWINIPMPRERASMHRSNRR